MGVGAGAVLRTRASPTPSPTEETGKRTAAVSMRAEHPSPWSVAHHRQFRRKGRRSRVRASGRITEAPRLHVLGQRLREQHRRLRRRSLLLGLSRRLGREMLFRQQPGRLRGRWSARPRQMLGAPRAVHDRRQPRRKLRRRHLGVRDIDLILENCTIANKHGDVIRRRVILWNASSRASLTSCIVWGNVAAPTDSSGQLARVAGEYDVRFSDVQGGWRTHWGNTAVEPDFRAPGDYALAGSSPCIDMGDVGHIDPDSTTIDMGAWYYPQNTVAGRIPPGTWDAASGPWVATGELFIEHGDTLVIEGGADVLFQRDAGLTVRGALLVRGTETDSVRILPSKATERGGGRGSPLLPAASARSCTAGSARPALREPMAPRPLGRPPRARRRRARRAHRLQPQQGFGAGRRPVPGRWRSHAAGMRIPAQHRRNDGRRRVLRQRKRDPPGMRPQRQRRARRRGSCVLPTRQHDNRPLLHRQQLLGQRTRASARGRSQQDERLKQHHLGLANTRNPPPQRLALGQLLACAGRTPRARHHEYPSVLRRRGPRGLHARAELPGNQRRRPMRTGRPRRTRADMGALPFRLSDGRVVVSGLQPTTDWRAGPVHVNGPLTVQNGDTLRIGPGVTVLFDQDVRITVRGRLEAMGTAADSIRIGPGQASEWRASGCSTLPPRSAMRASTEGTRVRHDALCRRRSGVRDERPAWTSPTPFCVTTVVPARWRGERDRGNRSTRRTALSSGTAPLCEGEPFTCWGPQT